jgi:hypothetical protein
MRFFQRLAAVFLILLLGACAVTKSHDKEASAVQAAMKTGGLTAALAQLEATAKTPEDKAQLLYNMERGELLRLNRMHAESTEAFLIADGKVQQWEDTAKTNPDKLLGSVGAALISERLKVYEGQDYEKVWLTTRLALNRLAQGDLERARVDVKRTHEREAVIAELRAKEQVKAEEQAKAKGADAQGKELNGYPVETLNDPEVLALRNGYSNALSHYLSGFVYEVLGESGLAAPGYRKAIELKPETAVLEEGLRGLDDRSSFMKKRRQTMTDVLFVVEAGNAPARKPKAFTVPVPTGRSIVTASISYPVIEPSHDALLSQLEAAGQPLKLEKVVDVNVMARRALKDEMPGMVLRGITRAVVKAVAQDQLQKDGGLAGALLSVAVAVGSVITEQADDRIWRMLPGRVYIARGYLPVGEHQVQIDGRPLGAPVRIEGQYAVVPLRIYEEQVIVGEISRFGQLPEIAAAPPTASPPPAVAARKAGAAAASTKRPAAADSSARPNATTKPDAAPAVVIEKTSTASAKPPALAGSAAAR